jgi:hypothetical protein
LFDIPDQNDPEPKAVTSLLYVDWFAASRLQVRFIEGVPTSTSQDPTFDIPVGIGNPLVHVATNIIKP